MRTREATVADIESIVDMSREFWKQTRYDEEYDAGSVERMAEYLIENGVFILLVDEEDNVVGQAAAALVPLLAHNAVLGASEVVFYIYPEYRKELSGYLLMKALETHCKDKGVVYMSMIAMYDVEPEAAMHLYEREGYTLNELVCTKKL